MSAKILVCVDPGGTTGIAVLKLTADDVTLEETHQWTDPDTVWSKIYLLASYWEAGYDVELVVEQFDDRPGVVNPDYSAKYIIKDIDRYIIGYPIHYQIVAMAKNAVKQGGKGQEDQLKRFGMYQPGKKHARDAIRHGIAYAAGTLKHRPTIELGWPKDKD